MSPGLVLENAAPDDLAALASLEARCHSHPWPEAHFRQAIGDERTLLLVLREARRRDEAGRGILAFLCLQTVADEAHVHDLAVEPGRRRRGLGRRLLRLGLDLAWRRGAETAFLEVRRSNEAALALYTAEGFEALAVRRDYYANPREDALVLRREAPGRARREGPREP